MIRRYGKQTVFSHFSEKEANSFGMINVDEVSPSVFPETLVDKTYFRPEAPYSMQIGSMPSAVRRPEYDYPDGEVVDSPVNMAWLRSPARDRVDIDLALQVVRASIESARQLDEKEIEENKEKLEALEKSSDILSKAVQSGIEASSSNSGSSDK